MPHADFRVLQNFAGTVTKVNAQESARKKVTVPLPASGSLIEPVGVFGVSASLG